MAELGAAEILASPDARIAERVANLTHVAKKAQQRIVQETGGSVGLRDHGALASAVGSAFQTFYGEDLHETVWDKAAALMRSLSLNHPFVDGNKRTSLLVTATFLLERGYGIRDDVPNSEIVDFCTSVAAGEQELEQISEWLKSVADDKSAGRALKEVMRTLALEDETS